MGFLKGTSGFFMGKNIDLYIYKIVSLFSDSKVDGDFLVKNNMLEIFDDRFFILFFNQFVESYNLYENKQLLESFSNNALCRVRSGLNILQNSEGFFIHRFLFLLSQNQEFNIESYLDKIILRGKDLEIFLESFCPISMPGGRKIKIDSELYNQINTLVGHEYLVKKIKDYFPNKRAVDELDKSLGVIDQFLYIEKFSE